MKLNYPDGNMRLETLEGSFSTVSTPIFASKYALESSRRDLHNALLCTALQSQFFVKMLPKNSLNFAKLKKIVFWKNCIFYGAGHSVEITWELRLETPRTRGARRAWHVGLRPSCEFRQGKRDWSSFFNPTDVVEARCGDGADYFSFVCFQYISIYLVQ